MKRERGIRRRELLKGIGSVTVAGLTASGAVLWPLPGCGRRDPLSEALVGVFADPEGAAAVGREYLRHSPEEAQPEKLMALLLGGEVEALRALAASDPRRLKRRLRERHRDDFEAGRVVRLRGWMLSRTEARLCALAALDQRRSRNAAMPPDTPGS